MFHKLDQPIMPEFVEKGSDIEIQNPVRPLAHHPDPQRIQCIVLTAPGPKPVIKAQKVLFPYLVENGSHRVLNDLIFQ
jgi:hypothetical protein